MAGADVSASSSTRRSHGSLDGEQELKQSKSRSLGRSVPNGTTTRSAARDEEPNNAQAGPSRPSANRLIHRLSPVATRDVSKPTTNGHNHSREDREEGEMSLSPSTSRSPISPIASHLPPKPVEALASLPSRNHRGRSRDSRRLSPSPVPRAADKWSPRRSSNSYHDHDRHERRQRPRSPRYSRSPSAPPRKRSRRSPSPSDHRRSPRVDRYAPNHSRRRSPSPPPPPRRERSSERHRHSRHKAGRSDHEGSRRDAGSSTRRSRSRSRSRDRRGDRSPRRSREERRDDGRPTRHRSPDRRRSRSPARRREKHPVKTPEGGRGSLSERLGISNSALEEEADASRKGRSRTDRRQSPVPAADDERPAKRDDLGIRSSREKRSAVSSAFADSGRSSEVPEDDRPGPGPPATSRADDLVRQVPTAAEASDRPFGQQESSTGSNTTKLCDSGLRKWAAIGTAPSQPVASPQTALATFSNPASSHAATGVNGTFNPVTATPAVNTPAVSPPIPTGPRATRLPSDLRPIPTGPKALLRKGLAGSHMRSSSSGSAPSPPTKRWGSATQVQGIVANSSSSSSPTTGVAIASPPVPSTSAQTAQTLPPVSPVPPLIPVPVARPIVPLPSELPASERCKGWKATYDPALDKNRSKGKDQIKEYVDAAATPGSDPRKRHNGASFTTAVASSRRKVNDTLQLLTWKWDKNSTGPRPPPPARAVLVTGISPMVTLGQLRSHFQVCGRIDQAELKMDPQTGQSLGIFWLKFNHDFEETDDGEEGTKLREDARPPGQSGHSSAVEAVSRTDGQLVGPAGLATKVKVELDGERKKYVATYREELGKRYSRRPGQSATTPVAPMSTPTSRVPSLSTPIGRMAAHGNQSPASSSAPTPAHEQALSRLRNNAVPDQDEDDPYGSRVHNTSEVFFARGGYRGRGRGMGRGGMLAGRLTTRAPMAVAAMRADTTTSGEDCHISDAPQTTAEILTRLAALGSPYLFTSSLQGHIGLTAARLKTRVVMHSPQMVACDDRGYYLGFLSRDAALQSKVVLETNPPTNGPLNVEVMPAPDVSEVALLRAKDEADRKDANTSLSQKDIADYDHTVGKALDIAERKVTAGWTERELRQEAEQRIIRELQDVFLRDLRNRVIGPHLSDFLRPEAAGGRALLQAATWKPPVEVATASGSGQKIPGHDIGRSGHGDDESHAAEELPSFRKFRKPSSSSSGKVNVPKKSHAAIEAAEITKSARDYIREKRLASKAVSPGGPTSPAAPVQAEGEASGSPRDVRDDVPSVTKAKKSRKIVKNVIYSSDEEEEEEEEEEKAADNAAEAQEDSIIVEEPKTDAPAAKKKARPSKPKKAVTFISEPEAESPLAPVSEVLVEDQQSPVEPEEAPEPSKPKKTKATKPPAGASKVRSPSPDPYVLGLVDEEEDFYYLQVALDRLRSGEGIDKYSIPEDVGEDGLDDQQRQEEDEAVSQGLTVPRHASGSARTEGFYKIAPSQKAVHLADRNKAIVDPTSVTLSSARDNRADSRRLVLGIEQHKKETASDTDILKFNQLRTRKKQLKFAKSPIHDWGLYAMETIPAGDMVIEYVGEIVRQQVADYREKFYEKQGNFSTYLFRVDDDIVVDATHAGNIARLMNHCCVPNCNAKILTLNGAKRIVIYAKQTILPGQELTYDYKFQGDPAEALEDRMVCLCGAEGCRRFL